MSIHNVPPIGPYTKLEPFRFWCQKVIPLVYDESLSYYELLCKVVDYLNKTMEDVDLMASDMAAFRAAYSELVDYVNSYFDNLDVQAEINRKLDRMAATGALGAIIEPYFQEAIDAIYETIPAAADAWLAANIEQTESVILDSSLLLKSAAADSKAVGDHLRTVIPSMPEIGVFTEGYYYPVASVGNTATMTQTAASTMACTLFDVTPGDIITLYGNSTTGVYRRYMFVDSSNKSIAISGNTAITGLTRICAPTGAAKMVVNFQKASLYYAYNGTPLGVDNSYVLKAQDLIRDAEIINGGVSSTSGNISESENSVVTVNLMKWTALLRAKIEEGYTITPYAYKADGDFLGAYPAGSGSVVDYDTMKAMKTTYPSMEYVRLRIGTSAKPIQTNTFESLYGEILEIKSLSSGILTLEDFQPFAEADGSFIDSFAISVPYNGDDSNVIYTIVADYEQGAGVTALPSISFITGSGLAKTIPYILGGKNTPVMKEFRTVRYPGDQTAVTISVYIPSGVTVHIRAFNMRYDNETNRYANGIEVYGHRRIPSYPWDSLASASLAAKAGKFAMVQIPKRLSDGTWIFYHDDELVYNDTYIRQADGTQLPSSYDGTLWSDISYTTAASWDWGVYFGDEFKGTKPMTADEFFGLCAKTGMKPALSIHPFPSQAQLAELRELARKYNVLSGLTVKCSAANIPAAYNVFKNEVFKYVLDVAAGPQTAAVINSAISTLNNLTGCTVRRTIELFSSTAYAAYTAGTPWDPFGMIRAAGFGASITFQNGAYDPTTPGVSQNVLREAAVNYYVEKGVTEFTEENNWSDGLNW